MNRRIVPALVVTLLLAYPVWGQDSESTMEMTTTTTAGEYYFFAPLNMNDAIPLPTGQLDLRLRYEYVTGANDDDRRDGDDDHVVGARLVWGAWDNLDIILDLPVNLGDGGNADGGADGNADVTVGLKYRFLEEQGDWIPATALSAEMRLPTGDRSSGVDGDFRLLMTKTYDSGLRSHINGFLTTVNGDNEPDARDFQWGMVVGMDGPLCADGAVRWIADYMNRSSEHYGTGNENVLELGTEWTAAENSKFGMSTQVGLDDNDDTPQWGMRLNWSYSILR